MSEPFKFSGAYAKEAKRAIAKYPKGREQSAVLALLDLAQRQNAQNGHYVSDEQITAISQRLNMSQIRIREVASFFTMINLRPVGKYHLQLCGTTPCWLRGAADLRAAIEQHLDIKNGGTTTDGLFTLSEVECLGACCNAPMIQINDDYVEDLDVETTIALLDDLRAGKPLKAGSAKNRQTSAPDGDRKTLLGA